MTITIYPFDLTVSRDTVRMMYRLPGSNDNIPARGKLQFTEAQYKAALELHYNLRVQFREWKTSSQIVRELGELLGDLLFDSSLRRCIFDAVKTIMEDDPDGIIRIMLNFEDTAPHEIANLPWELCHIIRKGDDTGRDLRIASDPKTVFIRGEVKGNIHPLVLQSGEKLKILLIIAEPQYDRETKNDMSVVFYEQTLNALRQFKESHSALVNFEYIEDGKPNNTTYTHVKERLNEFKPHLVHFIGHGRVTKTKSEVAFSANTEIGTRFAAWIDDNEFAEIFREQPPFLVLLQSCETAATAEVYNHRGIAGGLLKLGIPLVVAMQYEIQKSTANRFFQHFYEAIFHDYLSVDRAIQLARHKLLENLLDRDGTDSFDSGAYATPVLFSQIGDSRLLFRPQHTPVSSETIRNALWELNYNHQERLFRGATGLATKWNRTAGFLISGKRYSGHLWILNRLVMQYKLWETPPRDHIGVKLDGVGRSEDLWLDIATFVLPPNDIPGQVDDDFKTKVVKQIIDTWHDGSVLFIFDNADRIVNTELEHLIQDFWGHIVSAANERPSSDPSAWLLMFLVDRENKYSSGSLLFSDFNDDWTPDQPLDLSCLEEEFEAEELWIWLQTLENRSEYSLFLKQLREYAVDDRKLTQKLAARRLPEKILDGIYAAVRQDTSELNDGHLRRLKIR